MADPERTGFHLEINSLEDLVAFLDLFAVTPDTEEKVHQAILQLRAKREGLTAALEAQQAKEQSIDA